MIYDKQILQILTEVGEQGISVRFLARHVYNMNSTLFTTPDMSEIHNYVQQYLSKNSKSQKSLIEKTERRGWYHLNTSGSEDARQLMLDFKHTDNTAQDTEKEKIYIDRSLSLFD